MAEERVQRRLAAILAADVVGFSRLMEQDEAGTIAALKSRRRAVLEPLATKHQGRVFKVTGDGVLVEFASAVNAVQCAVELQQGMAAANGDQPGDRDIVLRIGVNLGDVVVEGSDLYGDGVNIAARLETIADPGGILISGTAHDHIRNKVKLAFDDLGTRTLKNIVEPVRVYRISGAAARSIAASKVTVAKPTIAVLPFDNLSGDPEQQYFSDGITEDIITELSRFRQLFVIARNSSFQYRGGSVDVRRVGRELGVQYVVEGRVRRLTDRIRISAQLIDANSGNHLWADPFDRSAQDLFEVQDEVTRTIVATLFGKVEDAGADLAKRKHPESLAAYDYLLRGIEHHQRQTISDNERGREMLAMAIKLDPELAIAYAWLALVEMEDWFRDGSVDALNRSLDLARKANALDQDDARTHVVLGFVYLYRRDYEKADFHHRRAIALNPNDAHIAAHMGLLHAYMGKPEEGLAWFQKAMQLNPFPPMWYTEYQAIALFTARRYGEAIRVLEEVGDQQFWDKLYLAASYLRTDRPAQARAHIEMCRAMRPGASLISCAAGEPYRNPEDQEHLVQSLGLATPPE